MTDEPVGQARKPQPVTGIRHAVSAASYSYSGCLRLLQEEAFRQEILVFLAIVAVFAAIGAPLSSFAVQGVLFLVLLAVEALNTAIEVLVDRISPGYAEFARHAKDLGSFAVFCLLTANGITAAILIWQAAF